jgi:hypothetical protein
MNVEKELTYGQMVCGCSFNPTNNDLVADLKQRFANIVDILVELESSGSGKSALIGDAIKEIITAQMWAVKASTWTH